MTNKDYDKTLSEEERRSKGVHYTPPDFSRAVVLESLRPYFHEHPAPSSNQILSLRFVEPAMGGGSILVELCRVLGDKLQEAWQREGFRLQDAEKAARFLVAERCLYGVDIDGTSPRRTAEAIAECVGEDADYFRTLHHHLGSGDFLVGVDVDDIIRFHWSPREDETVWEPFTSLEEDKLDVIGRVLIGAFFAHDKDAAREKERKHRLEVALAYAKCDDVATTQCEDWSDQVHRDLHPVNFQLWWPELFPNRSALPSFIDGFIGNPPFVGGSRISSTNGSRYLDWLRIRYGGKGHVDLSAYFLLRSWQLLGRGTAGFIMPNTVAQGDTREAGLKQIVNAGGRIYSAWRDVKWRGDASVTTSSVFLAKYSAGLDVQAVLHNGRYPGQSPEEPEGLTLKEVG